MYDISDRRRRMAAAVFISSSIITPNSVTHVVRLTLIGVYDGDAEGTGEPDARPTYQQEAQQIH